MTAFGRLALHTWTLDTTPLVAALAAAREGGFDAVELRRTDFKRCYEQGLSNDAVLDMVRAAGIPVCTLGCEYGWLFANGDESTRLFDDLEVTCDNAVALDCPLIMCAPGQNVGPKSDAIDNLKRGADICGKRGLKPAIEFNSQHAVLNSIASLREILNGAGRDNAGMLLDAYHMERSGAGGRGFEDVAPRESRISVQRCASRGGRDRREASDRPSAAGPGYRALARRVQAAQGEEFRRLSEL